MKKRLKCLLCMLIVFPLFSCGINNPLKAYQGHYEDLNDGATLDIKGNKMTITYWGKFKYTYKIKLETNEYGSSYIHSVDPTEGFGDMSELEVTKDGYLRAYEMVLDATGHTYIFMNEEQKKAALEIKDDSKDMAKVIESDELDDFSLSFSLKNERSYDLDDNWGRPANFSISVNRMDDGSYEASFSETFESYMGKSYNGQVSDDFIERLVKILKSDDILSNNGYYLHNEVTKPGYSLYATFTSNEKIRIIAYGDAANTCVFKLSPIMELFNELLEKPVE